MAIDLAVTRAALFGGPGLESSALGAFYLLPMIDALLIGLYRLRRAGRRTGRAAGFLIGGSLATAATFVSCYTASEIVFETLRTIARPFALLTINGLTRWLGNAAMRSGAMELLLGISFELLCPMAYLCGPALVVALCGRTLGGRLELGALGQAGPIHGEPVAVS
jgi:hypothetical protein